MARFGDFDQYLDNAGDPLAEGKLYFYESGTTTPKTTYADINNSIPNTNPVLLSAAGRQPNIFFDGVAKVILTDNNDVQIAVRDPAGETGTDFGDEWVATKIYNAVDVVLGSDGIYYRSLINGNQNNNPVTTTGSWTLLYSVEWNAGITYSTGDVVTYGSQQYQSLQDSNLNQNPSTQAAYWVGLSFAWLATTTYATGMNAVGTDGVLYTSLQDSNTGNDPATSPAYWVGTSAAAAASATAAANSATAAAASETAAAASETAAAASETAAAASETAAAASESAAATSETNAANSATAAATSETNAAASETAAASSASAASTSETNAAASASAASTSETNAAASETAAAASETAAAVSESAAATSETNAANSASASSTSASNASTSETNAASSATAAAGSATAAAASATAAETAETGVEAAVEEFEGLYLGAKSTPPTTDNQGNPLQTGALYFNTVSDTMFVWSGSSWAAAGSAVNGTAERQEYVATSGQTNFSATYDVGFVDVYLNGSKLIPTTDFTAGDGATIILSTGATAGDNVSIIAYGAFNVADVYTQAQSNARYTQQSNNLSDLDNAATALTNLGLTATAAELNYTDGVTSNIQTQIDNIDALPSQTGNAGNYLTTDGTDASWAEVSASPTLEATASGTLANGDKVIINADGTVSFVEQTIDPTPSLGSPVVYETGNSYYNAAVFDSNSNKIVIAYQDNSNSQYGTAVVGTVSGESISFGTPVVFISTAVYRVAATFDSSQNKVVIAFQESGGTNYLTAIVGDVSGTSISFGSKFGWRNTNSDYMSVTFDSNENKAVMAYQDAGFSSYGYAAVGTITGTSINVGSPVNFNAATVYWVSVTFDSNSNKVVIVYRDNGNSDYGTAIVGTVSGTSISFGSPVVFSSTVCNQMATTFDSNSNKVVIAYQNSGNFGYGTAIVGTVSGTSISFGSPAVFQTTLTQFIGCEFDSTNKKIILAYKDDSTSYGYVVVGTVSGTSISFGTPLIFENYSADYIGLAFDSVAQRSVIAYRDGNNSNYGTAIVFKSQIATTNLTEENYIGISDGAYSDAATAKIQIIGSVDDAQSGLTAGQKYYVQQDGTLAVTPDNPSVFAGTAVSATKLIVKG